jgi:hypothetical protein
MLGFRNSQPVSAVRSELVEAARKEGLGDSTGSIVGICREAGKPYAELAIRKLAAYIPAEETKELASLLERAARYGGKTTVMAALSLVDQCSGSGSDTARFLDAVTEIASFGGDAAASESARTLGLFHDQTDRIAIKAAETLKAIAQTTLSGAAVISAAKTLARLRDDTFAFAMVADAMQGMALGRNEVNPDRILTVSEFVSQFSDSRTIPEAIEYVKGIVLPGSMPAQLGRILNSLDPDARRRIALDVRNVFAKVGYPERMQQVLERMAEHQGKRTDIDTMTYSLVSLADAFGDSAAAKAIGKILAQAPGESGRFFEFFVEFSANVTEIWRKSRKAGRMMLKASAMFEGTEMQMTVFDCLTNLLYRRYGLLNDSDRTNTAQGERFVARTLKYIERHREEPEKLEYTLRRLSNPLVGKSDLMKILDGL